MANYFLQLTTGTAPGPFDVYLSGSSGETLYSSDVTKVQLQAGISINVPDGVPSSSVVVYNNAYGCSNEVQVMFPTPPASLTPTPSITPSITPTITPTLSIAISITPTISISPTVSISISPSPTITPTRTITPSPTITPSITATPSITPSVTPVVTCSNYEITNNGGTSILWNGSSCVSGNPVGGTVSGGGTTVYTGCIRDDSFSYGDNGSVVVTPIPC